MTITATPAKTVTTSQDYPAKAMYRYVDRSTYGDGSPTHDYGCETARIVLSEDVATLQISNTFKMPINTLRELIAEYDRVSKGSE